MGSIEQRCLKHVSIYWFLILDAVSSRRAAGWRSCMDSQWSCTASHYRCFKHENMPKGSYGPAELIWTAAKKMLPMIMNGPAEMLPVSLHGPIVADKNTTNGNEWACCSSWDAAEALIWAHCCCSKFCWRSQMVPAVFLEMLPVYLYGLIDAGKKYHWWHERAHCYSRDAAEALVWAHRCCRKNLPMVTKRPATSPEGCFQ